MVLICSTFFLESMQENVERSIFVACRVSEELPPTRNMFSSCRSRHRETTPAKPYALPSSLPIICSCRETCTCPKTGFATDGEVTRQLDALLWALQLEASRSASPWCAQDPVGRSYRLMQYNPPYTLPWQRTNAIAVQVYKEVPGDSADAENAKGVAGREQVSSTISQSTGNP